MQLPIICNFSLHGNMWRLGQRAGGTCRDSTSVEQHTGRMLRDLPRPSFYLSKKCPLCDMQVWPYLLQ